MGAPSPLKSTPMGYGGAWVGGLGWGHEFGLAIESLPCHLLARPTSGFKPTPIGPRPNPRPNPNPRWWLGRFQPTQPPPPPTPYPTA
ncbi:hypothetical protein HanRHA438_Chr01g0006461 [Helianthus annuus]|nr:hypothetical protein HanRHA438_Chr01g0006461 [Helianthus annuus]